MPSGRADDTGRFMKAVSAYAAEPELSSEDGRLLVAGLKESDGIFPAILDEIDETVLRRKLVFTVSGGAQLSVDVVERRVVCVLELSGLDVQEESQIVGRGLSRDDSRMLVGTLLRFCANQSKVSVRSYLPEQTALLDFNGVPVHDLRISWQASRNLQLPSPLVVAFDQCQKVAEAACLYVRDDEVKTKDNASCCQQLRQLRETLKLTKNASPSVTLWQGGLKTDFAIIYACRDDVMILLLCRSEFLEKCFAVCQNAIVKTA